MKNYAIAKVDDNHEYNLLVLGLTHESVFTFYNDLVREPEFSNSHGVLLLDQLLATGNGENRYIAIPYNRNVLDFSQAKKVDVDNQVRQISTSMLLENISILANSILTEEQRELIRQKIAL